MKMLSLNVAIKAVMLATVCSLLTLPVAAATDTPATTAGQRGGPGAGTGHRGGPGGPGPNGPGIGRRGGADGSELIKRADSNNDGKVSLEEFLEPRLSRLDNMFERRDDNGDGVITEGEGRPARPAAGRGGRGERGPRGRPPARAQLDRADIVACVKKAVPDFDPPTPPAADDETRFEAADANNDGKLTLAEITAAETAQAKARFGKLDSNGDGFITAADISAKRDDRADVAAAMRDCMKKQ